MSQGGIVEGGAARGGGGDRGLSRLVPALQPNGLARMLERPPALMGGGEG
jgi:hypothetical protein